jgi:broad specificity phosphatase PhoE
MDHDHTWPDAIWIVRHGESAGNVARDAALAGRQERIALSTRDVDVPLSPRGERQAEALGRWFGEMQPSGQPNVVLTSPYLRACRTAEIIGQAAGLDVDRHCWVVDERLREKEFGILDGLTRYGIEAQYPEQARLRRSLGKFYHRPPGGESWCDVILRLRSVVDTLTREYRGQRVLIVAHTVVVLCFRYLFEHLTEQKVLAVDRETDVANCSVTSYAYDPTVGWHGKLVLRTFNFVAPVEEAGAEITKEPDATTNEP